MRGGVSYEMSSTCVQGGIPRPLGGYQPNMMMEPHSPAAAWNYHSVLPKQEPVDLERNDSGINSGSDFHSSSPGSDHSQDLNIPYTSPAPNSQVSQSPHNPAYYSTPVISKVSNPASMLYHSNIPSHLMYSEHPLTPPSSEPMVSPQSSSYEPLASPKNSNSIMEPKCEIFEGKDNDSTLTPYTSPSEDSDHLRKLMALGRTVPSALSPKLSEYSAEGENKSDTDMDEYDEQGLRIPKVNSHGKVKTFKCKQCDFMAITKLDFWEHSKGHIKTDKLLTCPKCPFVTEYKHHLEYHLRNHFGSKPFKCTQCNYSCVNKSMLNSHLKSHSNIYQYRCSDCSYATKYCHSLKLHLRKYSHKPAMVLNTDGTPNPLPIIDVYGTRRGPKLKSQNSKMEEEQQQPSQIQEQMLPFALNQFMMNASPQMQLPFPYPFFAGFPGAMANPLLLQSLQKLARERQGLPPAEENEEPEPMEEESDSGALDLSKPDGIDGDKTIKNRRKGRAFKLAPEVASNSTDDEEDENTTTMFGNVEVVQNKNDESINKDDSATEDDKEEEVVGNNNNNNKNDFSCQYCSINFGDAVLYTMHMGYHGYKNPFTCNMCGEECKDKVSFFLHIARTPHS